jgi:hypothetical protein
MADNYGKLTTTEQGYWNVYTRLRQLSDWAGFTDGQDDAKTKSRNWLEQQRKEIWRQAQPKSDGGDGKGWDVNNRRERYAQLADDSLNGGSPRNLCQLPTGGGTATEKAKIAEREMWWNQSSVDDATKQWRTNNSSWLTERRKQLWHLINDEGGSPAYNRQSRYDAMCVATKTGEPYDSWAKTHDVNTGGTKPKPAPAPTPPSSREKAVEQARSYLGVHESPAGSNRGNPQPSGWQRRLLGSDGFAWCACFTTCMAWDAGVKGGSSAGVIVIMSMAQRGQGMFKGWTTDPSRVLRGDMAVIGCASCHIGLVADSNDPYHLIEGNTSPGSEGSQYAGGCVAEKRRPRGAIIGWALVDYP